MEIKVYATLRTIVGGDKVHFPNVSDITVGQMLQELFAKYPVLEDKFFDDQNELYPGLHILLNGRDIRYINGLETVITADNQVAIFPPVGGGIG